MKNHFLLAIFSAFLFSDIAFARFYLGTEVGYTKGVSTFNKYETNQNTPLIDETFYNNQHGITTNIIIGTEHFFLDDYLGIRWGAYGGYGFLKGDLANVNSFSLGANFDVIGNVFASEKFSIGFLLGGEYANIFHEPIKEIKIGRTFDGIEYSVSNKTSFSRMLVRAGFSTSISKNHRFEFIFKYPLAAPDQISQYVQDNNGKINNYKYFYVYEYLEAFLSYKYIF